MKRPATLQDLIKMSDDEARAYMEDVRWPNGPVCPHCGYMKHIYRLNGKSHRAGLLKCGECRKPFSVTMGTVMEDTHVPLGKWLYAYHVMCSSKKGVSSLQLKRDLDLGSYQTAWHMAHRIRLSMKQEPLKTMVMLKGIVEVDETYVGGKPRKGTGPHKRGRGTKKTPVMVLVERDGSARAHQLERVDGETLKALVRAHVDPTATIYTDDNKAYGGLSEEFAGGHEFTTHSQGEYARGRVHSNSAEAYFALVKRSHYGIHHQYAKKHLHRYLAERDFVWNGRKSTDGERRDAAIRGSVGKRLMYKTPVRRTQAESD